jgi:hypothetical protein
MAYVGIETRVEDNKVQCKLCLKYNSMSYRGDWIMLKTYKTTHQKTSIHLESIVWESQQMDIENRQLQEMPGYFASLKNINIDMVPSVPSHGTSSAQWAQEQEMWHTFDGTFELEDGAAELHEKARKAFELQANLSGLWAGLEAIPNNNINELQQLWEEEEHDDLLSEVFEQIGTIL